MSEQSALCKSKEGNGETDVLSLQSVWNPQDAGQGWEKRENPRVESKFSVMLQMVLGHQMQMRALQLANPLLSCQKCCQQSDTPSSPSTPSVGCTKKWIYGKGTVAGIVAKPLQAAFILQKTKLQQTKAHPTFLDI